MNEVIRIRDQLDRALRGEAWHGPALLEILGEVDARTAADRPIAGAHSIWEIVLHLTASVELVVARLRGEPKDLTPEEDWPPQPDITNGDAWCDVVAALERAHGRLFAAIEDLAESRLDEAIVPGFSGTYLQLHGTVQHDLYHAGQIVLLARASRARPRTSKAPSRGT
jgi:uncharacterized damage-inducible protein DinB